PCRPVAQPSETRTIWMHDEPIGGRTDRGRAVQPFEDDETSVAGPRHARRALGDLPERTTRCTHDIQAVFALVAARAGARVVQRERDLRSVRRPGGVEDLYTSGRHPLRRGTVGARN